MPDAHALWRTLRAATLVPSASAPADAATCAPHLSPPTPQTPSSGQPAQRCRGARCGGGRAGAGGGARVGCAGKTGLCLASRQRQLQTARNCASCNLPPPDRNKLPNPCQLPSQPCWLQARTVPPPPPPPPPHPTPHRLLPPAAPLRPRRVLRGVKEPGRPSHARGPPPHAAAAPPARCRRRRLAVGRVGAEGSRG